MQNDLCEKKKKMQVYLTCLEQRMHKPARQKIELNKWSGARTKRAYVPSHGI